MSNVHRRQRAGWIHTPEHLGRVQRPLVGVGQTMFLFCTFIALSTVRVSNTSAQSMPAACTRSLKPWPAVVAGERLSGDERSRAILDSAFAWEEAHRMEAAELPPQIHTMMGDDSAGALATLAEAVADPSRYGTERALLASAYYRILGGPVQPMLQLLTMSPEVSRRALGLRSISRLDSPEERSTVLDFACSAAWQLLPFLSDSSFGNRWARVRFDTWPEQAAITIREASRLLGGFQDPPFRRLLRRIEQSGLRPDGLVQ